MTAIARSERVGGRAAVHRHTATLTGLWPLVRFDLRRERLRIPVWFVGVVGGSMAVAATLSGLYGQQQELAAVIKTMSSPAALAMSGPPHYLDAPTLGSSYSLRMMGYTVVLVGLMSIMIVSRNTRTEEETGRAELIRSAVVGRHAHLAAAVVVAVIANLLMALGLGLGLAMLGVASMDLPGALLYGSAHAAVGLFCTGVATITVQVTAHGRGAVGMGLAVAGLAYGLRAAGDAIGNDTLSWLSPVGWAQRTYAFVDNRWWPLLLDVGLGVAACVLGFALSARRDVGAGMTATREGPARASALLQSPVGLALRLQRGMIIGFGIGIFVLGVMYGSVMGSVRDMLKGIPQLDQALQRIGVGSLLDSFAALIMVVLGLIGSCFVAIAMGRPKSEAGAGRAEPLLSAGLSRSAWLGGHVAVVAAGGALMVLLAGLGFGLAGGIAVGDGSMVWRLTLAGLAYAPAIWVVLGVAAALYGWLPRYTAAVWILVVYGFFTGYFGRILQLPEWMDKLSPFGHVPQLPAAEMSWTPLVVLTVIAAALVALGMVGLQRRDLELR